MMNEDDNDRVTLVIQRLFHLYVVGRMISQAGRKEVSKEASLYEQLFTWSDVILCQHVSHLITIT